MDAASARAFKQSLDAIRKAIDDHGPATEVSEHLPARERFNLIWEDVARDGKEIGPDRHVLIGRVANEFTVVITAVDTPPEIHEELLPGTRTITADWFFDDTSGVPLTSEAVSTHIAMDESDETIKNLGLLEESHTAIMQSPMSDWPELARDFSPPD
jgi:hypothetical protein